MMIVDSGLLFWATLYIARRRTDSANRDAAFRRLNWFHRNHRNRPSAVCL